MTNCSVCRDLRPIDCPGCRVPVSEFVIEKSLLDVLSSIPAEHIHEEMFRDPGEYYFGMDES